MNVDTPLAEVVDHLPAEISGLLLGRSHETRVAVLSQVRLALTTMEARGARFDPATYDAVVHTVATMAILTVEQAETIRDVQEGVRKVLERVKRK